VTSSLEEETRTVEDQTRLAQDTGEAFSQIRQAIGVSRQEVGEIFALSQKQQNLTNQTVQSMKEVSGLSTQAMRMVKDSAHISEGLNGMSDTLLGSLSRFRLPDDDAVMPDEEFISLEEEEIDFPDEEFDSPLQEAGAQG
jgi:methyl-accepting chemotaxis protein